MIKFYVEFDRESTIDESMYNLIETTMLKHPEYSPAEILKFLALNYILEHSMKALNENKPFNHDLFSNMEYVDMEEI